MNFFAELLYSFAFGLVSGCCLLAVGWRLVDCGGSSLVVPPTASTRVPHGPPISVSAAGTAGGVKWGRLVE